MTGLAAFVFFLVIVIILVYVACLVIDWLCSLPPLPAPIPLLLKLGVVVVALLALYNHGIPFVTTRGLG